MTVSSTDSPSGGRIGGRNRGSPAPAANARAGPASEEPRAGNSARPVGTHFDGDLRRALMDSAIATLEEVGADNLSLRQVARRIGVSHAAPGYHFGDKAGLLTAIATEGFLLFADHLTAIAASFSEKDPLDLLARLGSGYVEFAEENPAHFEVMFRPRLIRSDDPDLANAGATAFDILQSQIERCQRAGWRQGADAMDLTVAAWALVHGISVLRAQGALAGAYGAPGGTGVGAIAASLMGPS